MTTNQPENSDRLAQIEGILLQIAQQQQINTVAIAENTAAIAENTNMIDALVETVSTMVSEGDADRRQATDDRQAWQTEIQRIWEYLLRQGGNGRNGGNG
jgi:hypothetical protein